MPKVVQASTGDTLCSLAIDAGFLNCDPLRNEPANAGKAFLDRPLNETDFVTIPDPDVKTITKPDKKESVFVKKNAPPIEIRFVHGSPDLHYRDDLTLTTLNVSKYVTDQGSDPDGSAAFPSDAVCEFNQAGHDDADTFKVEVFEPDKSRSQLEVTLEALKPVFDASGAITDHVPFDGDVGDATSERGKRSLKVTCKKVGQSETHRCRSPYLRLVVDEADKSGTVGPVAPAGFPPPSAHNPRPKQTLLVTDMTAEGDDTLEILDQQVRASTDFPGCKQSGKKKCVATVTLPIGTDRQRVRVAVHVLNQTVGGTPIVLVSAAKMRVTRWVRRIFAQASVAPKLLLVRAVDPVENMVCVSDPPPNAAANAGGRRAAGDGQVGFTINAAGLPSQVIGPVISPAGRSAIDTATALAALVQPPFTAVASLNARRFNDATASADILIKETSGALVTIAPIVSKDSAQTLTVASVNPLPAANQSWDGFNFLAGSAQQRLICRNYDTGDDRIDVFVVRATTGHNRGEAMIDGHSIVTPADQRGVPGIRMSLFVHRPAMNGSDNDPLVLAHEIGHVVADVLHASTERRQLMHAEVTGNNAVGSNKRIRNRDVAYGTLTTDVRVNFINRIRSEGAELLEPF